MNLILENIEKHILLNEEEKQYFCSLLIRKEVGRKQLLLQQDSFCRNINFVETGTLRAFYNNSDGKESTIMFAIEDWWITDMYSFVNQRKAMLTIQALEDSLVMQLDYFNFELLCKKVPKFERFFRIIMQNAYIREQLRTLDAISMSSEKRYQKFIAKYPQLMHKITQKQIASYLGITPEFLSTIKRKK